MTYAVTWGGVGGTRGRVHETSCSVVIFCLVSDERYLSVAKVPSSHSASRAHRDCAGTSRICAAGQDLQMQWLPRFQRPAPPFFTVITPPFRREWQLRIYLGKKTQGVEATRTIFMGLWHQERNSRPCCPELLPFR